MPNTEQLPSTPSLALAMLLTHHRVVLIDTWRREVRQLPHTAKLNVVALNDHIPKLLDELTRVLVSSSDKKAEPHPDPAAATEHALQRLHEGFDIGEVVAETSIMRRCIHDLADQHGLELQGPLFRVLNTVLDDAIAKAVQTYAGQNALQVQRRREDYLAFVAHDLRTPLNGLMLTADLLDRQVSSGADASAIGAALLRLRRNIELMHVLVEDVVKENINIETDSGIHVDRRLLALRPLVEGVIQSLYSAAEIGHTSVINEIAEGFMVCADQTLLWRIVQNLLANAIRFTPDGAVRISANLDATGSAAICEVADNGSGIGADRLHAVFRKLESGPRGSGLGLGLAVTRLLVQAHGGQIDVDSTVGKGSTFRFTLPLEAAGAGIA